jgi:hypothetical protein
MATDIRFTPYAPGTTDTELARISSVDPRLSRTNYFDGRLLKASDLTRDQVYLDERLLEVGQVLGSGIAFGLGLTLIDGHRLQLEPGIGIAPSGRVLELASRTLEVDLLDSALIATLNLGYHRRLRRGLYAVVIQHADLCGESAEAYPADLESRRGIRCGSFAEGVELALVPLELPLPQSDALGARAALVGALIAATESAAVLPEEAVPLGLLAVENGRPLWLDLGLVRRPLRPAGAPGALQEDLATHYDELLADVLERRSDSGLTGDFPAAHYFRLLPPYGRLPKGSVDPAGGRQGYFPSGYEVAVAPVRRDDLDAILRESAALAPMDLEKDQDADIMVMVPLSDQEFAWRARQLERGPGIPKDAFGLGRLLHIDRLALRLYPTPTSPGLDTDTAAWRDIWDQAVDGEVLFVRRPPRTAETNVSAVVLARGFELPDPVEGLPPDLEGLEAELDAAQEALDTAQAEADDLRRRLAALEAQSVDERIAALQAQVASLQRQLAAAEGDARALAQAEERIRQLTVQVSDLEAAVAAARAERDAATGERDAMTAERDALATERDALTSQRDALAAERDGLGNERDALQKALDDCRAQLGGSTQPPGIGSGLPDTLTVPGLALLRKADRTQARAAAQLNAALAGRPADQVAVIEIFVMVERRYDAALWGTLTVLARGTDGIVRFRDGLLELVAPDMPAERVVAQIGGGLGLTAAQIDAWQRLAG